MAKPPKTMPHSDLDGIHEDERSNVDVANEADQDSADLAHAKKEAIARPEQSDDREEEGSDDRDIE